MTVVVNSNASSNTWGNFIDVQQDAKPWLQIPEANTSGDVRLQALVDTACQWVQNYLGRAIGPTPFDRRYNGYTGWNGAYIQLPYYPVLEITSVTEFWGISGPHVLSESTPTSQIDGFQVNYLSGQLIRVFPGNVQKPWFPGSRNIEVLWIAGYNPVPADIKIAALEFIAHWWRNTQQQSGNRPGGISGDYDPAESQGLWAGVPNRITELLSPYVQVGMG